MKSTSRFLSRRSVVAGALLALSMAPAKSPSTKTAAAKIRSNEYWAQKGDVKLYMFRKRQSRRQGDGAAAIRPWREAAFHPLPISTASCRG